MSKVTAVVQDEAVLKFDEDFEDATMLPIDLHEDKPAGEWVARSSGLEVRHALRRVALATLEQQLNEAKRTRTLRLENRAARII
jgi:hypothetical protein